MTFYPTVWKEEILKSEKLTRAEVSAAPLSSSRLDGKIMALYCRLSQEDMQSGESMSIVNQRKLLKEYADNNHFFNTQFFVDDGVSGVSFQRKGLQEMLSQVEAGTVANVIVKDA